jgi:hypothetical protein
VIDIFYNITKDSFNFFILPFPSSNFRMQLYHYPQGISNFVLTNSFDHLLLGKEKRSKRESCAINYFTFN